jgi:hypothetical protein
MKISERRSSSASTMSAKSSSTRPSRRSTSLAGSGTERATNTSTGSTAGGYSLSHTLSSSSRFVDQHKRVQPWAIDRIDGLKIRLLEKTEKAMPVCLLDQDKDVAENGKKYKLPAISKAMALSFDISTPTRAARASWIPLTSCRRQPNQQVDDFVRRCYIRITEIADPSQAYLELPPCFYLSKVEFNMGSDSYPATFAWLEFDATWIRRTLPSALVTSISGNLARWRGYKDCNCDWVCQHIQATVTISYDKAVYGTTTRANCTLGERHVHSSKAFPAWLDARGSQCFNEWCGTPVVTEKAGLPHLSNFQAQDLQLDYFWQRCRVQLSTCAWSANEPA